MENIPEEVYREKYLKYKKKYLELSQTAGTAAPSLAAEEDAVNNQITALKAEFDEAYAAAMATLPDLYSGANDDQKLTIRQKLGKLFGSTYTEGSLEGVDEQVGEIPTAISALTNSRDRMIEILSSVLYTDSTGKKSKYADKVIAGYVLEQFTIGNIFTKVVEAYVNDFAKNVWKEYKFKKGMEPSQLTAFEKADNAALTLINKQIELDSTCEGMGLFKGPANCSETQPNTIGDAGDPGRPWREAQYKAKFELINAELKKNKDTVQGLEDTVVAAQKVYNAAKAELAKAHEGWLAILNKDAKSKNAEHCSKNDTLDVWTKNKDEVLNFLNAASCKQQSIEVKGECTPANILKTLDEKWKRPYDEKIDSFRANVNMSHIKG